MGATATKEGSFIILTRFMCFKHLTVYVFVYRDQKQSQPSALINYLSTDSGIYAVLKNKTTFYNLYWSL